jgi:hypothetical protein
MVQPPIVRDFAFVKSSVPFPAANNTQSVAPPEHHRQRTRSNSSTSSSSGVIPQPRPPTTSMSGRTRKQLSPVVEECEDSPSRRRLPSRQRVGSRAGHRHKSRPASYVGHTGIVAEDLTIAMMSMIPPPPRNQNRATARQRPTNKTKSRFQSLRQSIRARLPNICVWKRSWRV